MGHPALFLILALVAVVSAVLMVSSKSAVYSALWLVLNFTAIGILYIILNAPFIAMVQITVYAGAIMVLFLFVIMLLGAEELRGIREAVAGERWHRAIAIGCGLLLLASLVIVLLQGAVADTNTAEMIDSSPEALGTRLFEVYTLPFELTGVLLLAAIVGVAIFNVKKKKES